MNIKGQGNSVTLVQGHSDSTFSDFFSLKSTRPIKAKFHVEPPWNGGTKVCSNGLGHMTKMATLPIYVKILLNKKHYQKADHLENLYEASSTLVLPSLF